MLRTSLDYSIPYPSLLANFVLCTRDIQYCVSTVRQRDVFYGTPDALLFARSTLQDASNSITSTYTWAKGNKKKQT